MGLLANVKYIMNYIKDILCFINRPPGVLERKKYYLYIQCF